MKVSLVGLLYDRNMGDPLLFDCTAYLLKTIFASVSNNDTNYLNIEYTDILQREGFCPQQIQFFQDTAVLREKYSLIKRIIGKDLWRFFKDVKNYVPRLLSIRRFKKVYIGRH